MSVLIIYDGKSGTTQKAANLLKEYLPQAETVDIKKLNHNLASYDTVIIGSAIRMGNISKATKSFIAANQAELLQKKLGLFICCGLPEKAAQQLADNFPANLRQHAIATKSFGGEMNPDNLKGMDKFIAKTVIKERAKDPDAPITKLDLNAIKEFAAQLAK